MIDERWESSLRALTEHVAATVRRMRRDGTTACSRSCLLANTSTRGVMVAPSVFGRLFDAAIDAARCRNFIRGA